MKGLSYPIYSFVIALTFSALLPACTTSPDVEPTSTGEVTLEFDNVAGTRNLVLGSGTYQNAAGESFTVDMLNYFVSNIKLLRADGTHYTVPQDSSYFLILESERASQFVKLKNVPAGEYVGVEFVVGVDSLRSVSDISKRTGVLDPADASHEGNSMYWSWNSGYIFLKMEGTSPQAPADAAGNRKFRYHIGGFGGYSTPTFNNIRTVRLQFGSDKAQVGPGSSPEIHLLADVLKVFNGPTQLSIASNPTVMVSPFSTTVSNNYVNMFSYDHMHSHSH